MFRDAVGRRRWQWARGFGILVAVSIGMGGCGGAVGKTAAVARMAVSAATRAATGSPTVAPVITAPYDPAPAEAAPMSGTTTAPIASSSRSASAPTLATPVAPAATTKSSGAGPATGSATGGTQGTPVKAAVVALRRQPTAAEVSQAIKAVHGLVPFFTPTAADVADVGNQVCTAFDQGKTFSQVKSKALDMVGAGSLGWLIPSSVPGDAVRTLVNLYCPAYASKVA